MIATKSLLPVSSLAALGLFVWPLWSGLGQFSSATNAVLVALAAAALLAITFFLLDGELLGPKQLVLLGSMAALGAAIRIGTGGTAGLELVFVAVILGGAVFGPRFGFLLGAITILSSSIFFGGFGPWTAFQVFATGWVGAGASLVAKFAKSRLTFWLALYGAGASYLFGLIMNLWFWPSAIGVGSSIAYSAEATFIENLTSFLSFTLVSSTLTWDTVRAVGVATVILVFGTALIRTLRRAKV